MTGPQQSHDGYDSSNNQGHYDDQSPDYRDDYPHANTGGSGKFSFAAIVVMLVFAVVATILMLFTDSETWTKIAVLCALWAAIVGCIAVARLRKQVDNQQRDTDNLERLHQAELERELATHREQELILEQNYYDSLQEQEQNTLADIRAELTVLRENLSAMMGTDLDTERTALKAEAQRILELERDSKDSSSTTEARTSGSTSRTSSVPASHTPSGKRGQNRGGAGQTRSAGKPSGAGNTAAAQPGRTNQSSSGSRAADSTSTQQGDNSLRTGSFNAVKWTAQPSRRSGSGYSADQTTVLPSVEKKSNPQAQRSTGYGASQQRASQPSQQQRPQQSRTQQQQPTQQQPDRAAQNNQRSSAPQGSAVYRGADRDNSQFFAFGSGSSPASSAQPASGSSQPQPSRTESTPYVGSHRGPNPNANSTQSRSTTQSGSTTGGSRRNTDPDTGSFAAFGSGRSSAPSYDRTHAPTTGGFRAQSPSSGSAPASVSQAGGRSPHEGMFTGSQNYGSSASSSNTPDLRGRHEGPQDSSSGGRRRRADNGDSSQNVTVASLLEQLKKNSEK